MNGWGNISEKFGDRIRELREVRHWSQERVAEEAGIPRTHISGGERGIRNVSPMYIGRIAAALGIPIAALFEND